MLTRTEKRKIRATIIDGGSVNKALKEWAAGRGYEYYPPTKGENEFYVLIDIDGAVAEHAALRKKNKSPNTHFQSDDEYRQSLIRGRDQIDWCSKSDSYDSDDAWYLATATKDYLRGKSPEWIARNRLWGEDAAPFARELVRPLKALQTA